MDRQAQEISATGLGVPRLRLLRAVKVQISAGYLAWQIPGEPDELTKRLCRVEPCSQARDPSRLPDAMK